MDAGIRTIIYPVDDVDAATALFTAALGVAPTVVSPYYVGFDLPGTHVGLDPNGHRQGQTGPVPYLHVPDMGAALEAWTSAGGTITSPPRQVGGGRSIAVGVGEEGNVLGFIHDAPAAG